MKWNIAAECISAVMLSIIWAYSRKGLTARPMPEEEARRFCVEQAGLLDRYEQKEPALAKMT